MSPLFFGLLCPIWFEDVQYEEFESWVAAIPASLDWFFQEVAVGIRDQLDYSLESSDVLEHWLLERYSDLKSVQGVQEISVIKAAEAYTGETFRKHFGGKWIIDLENEDHVFLGIPGITNFNSVQTPSVIYPRSLVTASIDRRKGNFIRWQLERYLPRD